MFLISVVVQVAYLVAFRFSDGSQRVSWMPVQDAYYWYTQANAIAAGQGITPGLRPGYSVFLALVFTWTTPSVLAAQLANIATKAAAVSGSFLIASKLLGPRLGLLAAALLGFDAFFIDMSLSLMTENLGVLPVILTLLFFLTFLETRRVLPLVSSGLALGVSELTRPVATLWVPVACGLCLLVSRGYPGGLTRGVSRVVLFLLAVGLPLMPWVLHQHRSYGVWTLSINTAEALYAASSPRYGTWSPVVVTEAVEAGVRTPAEHYQFFRARAAESLRENLGFYVRNVARHLAAYYDSSGHAESTGRHLVSLLATILVCAVLMAGDDPGRLATARVAGSLVGAGAVAALLLRLAPAALSLAGIVAICRRPPCLLGLALVSYQAAIGMAFALFAYHEPRHVVMYSWTFIVMETAVAAAVARWCVGRGESRDEGADVPQALHPVLRTVGACAMVLLAVGTGRLVYRTLRPAPEAAPPIHDLGAEREAVVARMRSLAPYAFVAPEETFAEPLPWTRYGENHAKLVADYATADLLKYEISPKRNVPDEPGRLFGNRTYRFTVLPVRSSTYGMLNVTFPGSLPDSLLQKPILVVARLNVPTADAPVTSGFNAEGIAIEVLDDGTHAPRMSYLARGREHERILRGLARAAADRVGAPAR